MSRRTKQQEFWDEYSFLQGFYAGVTLREQIKNFKDFTDFSRDMMLILQGKEPLRSWGISDKQEPVLPVREDDKDSEPKG
jgi:hypothetical protein